jgi:hypothetical protein
MISHYSSKDVIHRESERDGYLLYIHAINGILSMYDKTLFIIVE